MMIHFILPGDSLQKIADEIHLENPFYLKEYHNNHCLREDYIYQDLIPGKKLMIPDPVVITRYNSRNDAPFKSPERNPRINFLPDNSDLHFKVRITETRSIDKKTLENEFSYVANLKWISSEFEEYLFRFSKEQFSNLNDTKMGDLAIETMKCLYPIEIFTNNNGEILRTKLTGKVLNDFSNIKEKLLDLFPDQYAKIYLDEFEYIVLNADLFDKRMKKDLFLKTYFSSVRNSFNNGNSFFELSLNGSLLNIRQSVEKTDNEEQFVLTQTLNSSSKERVDFNGEIAISKDNGLVKNLNFFNAYQEYGADLSTKISIESL